MNALRILWHTYLAVGPLSVGYLAGRTRPWRRFGDLVAGLADRDPRGWRAVLPILLMVIYDPRMAWWLVKWAFGWRPPRPERRRPVAPEVSEQWKDGSA